MIKRVAVLLNTDQLGGAERSMVEQCAAAEGPVYTFYFPRMSSSAASLQECLRQAGLPAARPLPFPSALYRISRQRPIEGALRLLGGMLALPSTWWAWTRELGGYDTVYANGNKVLLPAIAALGPGRVSTLVWHFRDFPSSLFFRGLCWLLLARLRTNVRLRLIANSAAVAAAVRRHFPGREVEVLYNLAGAIARVAPRPQVKRVGVVAMLTPWKGLHEVVLTAAIYEKELRTLGIEEIVIYGAGIYHTSSGEGGYPEQLRRLASDLKAGLIVWGGVRPPAEIFSAIDVLIHPSLVPEPFGRVLCEAQKAGVPVISTALGGAAEVVCAERTGLTYIVHDYRGLFDQIARISADADFRHWLIEAGHANCKELEAGILATLASGFMA